MEEICTAKLRQCKRFREALILTGDARLIHNTESDSVWGGCGLDLQGQNMMGNILLEVREKAAAYDKENCVYLCNAKSKLYDGIHFTNSSKDFVARTGVCHIRQCV